MASEKYYYFKWLSHYPYSSWRALKSLWLPIITALLVLLLHGSPCVAQLESTPSSTEPIAGGEMLLFQEIPSVYGASKYEQKLTEAPSSVTIITASEIKKLGYRTLAEVLQSATGFFTTYDRNYSYLGIRGFARPGDYNTRVLLLVDGHRINDVVYEQAPIGNDFTVDIDLVDRVEIIRGPSSSIYGSSAFFGVVNVITRQGRELKGVELSGEAASYDTYKGRATYGNRFANGLELLLSASYLDSVGQDLYFKEFDRRSTRNGIARDSDDESYRSFFSKLSYRDFSLEAAYNFREKTIPTAPWGTIFGDPRTRTMDERAYLDMRYERAFEGELGLTAHAYYDRYNYDGHYMYSLSDFSSKPTLYKDFSVAEGTGIEVQISKKLFEKHKVLFGAEYREGLHQEQGAYYVNPYKLLMDDERRSGNSGVYLQDEYRILDNLILNAGLRYDWYETFGATVNPRIGLIYQPLKPTTIKLLYGQAYRAPNAYELYYGDNITQRANPDLDPEDISTYELVWEQLLGERFRLSVSGFYYDIDRLISLTNPGDDVLMFKNLDEVSSRGVELELDGRWPANVESRVSYSYQDARDVKTDEILTNSPEHMAKVNVIVPLIEDKIFAGAELRYMSMRRSLRGEDADDSVVVNLTLLGQRLVKGLDVSVSVYNLFDQEYGDPGSEEHVQDIINQDGINFRVKVTYSF